MLNKLISFFLFYFLTSTTWAAIFGTIGGTTNVTTRNYATIQLAYNSATVAGENYYFTINNNYNPAIEPTPVVFPARVNNTVSFYVGDITPKVITKNGTVFSFTGGDNISFSGSYNNTILLTLQNTSTAASAPTLSFSNESTNNRFNNLNIFGSATGSSATGGVILFAGSTATAGNSNNLFYDCTIGKDNVSNMPHQLISSAGTSGKPNDRIEFNNCYYQNFGSKIFYIDSLTAQANFWRISGGSAYQTANYTTPTNIIAVDIGSGEGHNVSFLKIGGQAVDHGGAPFVLPPSSTFKGVVLRSNISGAALNPQFCSIHLLIKNLQLTNNTNTVAFNGGESRNPLKYVLNVTVEEVTLTNNGTATTPCWEGLRLFGTGGTESSSSLQMKNCTINGTNTASYMIGVRSRESVFNLDNSLFENITLPSSGQAAYVLQETTGSATIYGTTIQQITVTANQRIRFFELTAASSITLNTISTNTINWLSSTNADEVALINASVDVSISNSTFINLTYAKSTPFFIAKTSAASVNFTNCSIGNILQSSTAPTATFSLCSSAQSANIINCRIGGDLLNDIRLNANTIQSLVRTTASGTITLNNNQIKNITIQPGTSSGFTMVSQPDGILNLQYNILSAITNNSSSTTEIPFIEARAQANITFNTFSDLRYENATAIAQSFKLIKLSKAGVSHIVSQNNISGLSVRSTAAGSRVVGIEVAAGSATLANNVIQLNNNGLSNAVQTIGIQLSASATATQSVYHNTIKIFGTQTGAALSTCLYRTGATPTTVQNNVFQNKRSGGATEHVTEHTITGGYSSNSNYIETNTPSALAVLGATLFNLSNWRTTIGAPLTISGSVVIDADGRLPLFSNFYGLNLITLVPIDIIGAPRLNPPVLGAYQSETKLTFTSVTPAQCTTGDPVRITGVGFLSKQGETVVRFNGNKATILSITDTEINVTAPSPAYGYINITTNGLTIQSKQPYLIKNTGTCTYLSTSRLLNSNQNTIAVLDANDDGIQDMVDERFDYYRLNAQLQSTLVQDVSTDNTRNVILGDINRDGKLDMSSSTLSWLNTGATFTEVNANQSISGSSLQLADINNDGILDKLFYSSRSIQLLLGNATSFGLPTPIPNTNNLSQFKMVDVNNDGFKDIIGYESNFNTLKLLISNGPATYSAPIDIVLSSSSIAYTSLETGDIDNDGDIDLLAGKVEYSPTTNNPIGLLINSGIHSGVFGAVQWIPMQTKLSDFKIGDLTGDGKLDIVAADKVEATLSVYPGIGNGTFAPRILSDCGFNPQNIVLQDMNDDGYVDIVINHDIPTFASQTQVLLGTCERPAPSITSLNNSTGKVGDPITITGRYFDPIVTNNTVLFGDIPATVVSASPTQLVVQVPLGATNEKIQINVGIKSVQSTNTFTVVSNELTCVNQTALGKQIKFTLAENVLDQIVVDANNDGKKDILHLFANQWSVRWNTSTSTLVQYANPVNTTISATAVDIEASDMDNDGDIDVVVMTNSRTFLIYENNGSGIFNTPITIAPAIVQATGVYANLKLIDITKDGFIDILCTWSQGILLLRHESTALQSNAFSVDYELRIFYTIRSLDITDLDQDGFPDFVLAISTNTTPANELVVYKNYNAAGGRALLWGRIQYDISNPSLVTITDVNDDDKPDVLYVASGQVTCLFNSSIKGTVTLTNAGSITNQTFLSISIADVDGDGKPDVIGTTTSALHLLKNNSTSSTLNYSASSIRTAPSGLVFKHLNVAESVADTKADIILTATNVSGSDSLIVYKNWVRPTATISGVDTICSGITSTAIKVNLSGSAPWSMTYSNGTSSTTINDILSDNITLNLSPANSIFTPLTTNYTLQTVTNSFGTTVYGCTGISGVVNGSGRIVTNAIPPSPTLLTLNPSRCGIGTDTLQAEVRSGTLPVPGAKIHWYTTLTSTDIDTTSFTYITPPIATNTSFYALSEYNKCFSVARTKVDVVVNARPSILSTVPGNRCDPGAMDIAVVPDLGTTTWYETPTGGASIASGNVLNTGVLTANKTYYAQVVYNGCTTPSNNTRIAVPANINITPVLSNITNAQRCDPGTVFLSATTNAGVIHWYNTPTATTPFLTGTTYGIQTLPSSVTYYIEGDNNGCKTASRLPISATVTLTPTITTTLPAARCDSGTVTLSATSSGGIIKWYNASSGGDSLFTGTSYTTPKLTSTTTYYVQASNGVCVNTARTAITANVSIPVIAPSVLVNGRINTPYPNTSFTVSHLVAPVWSIVGTLPPGMTFSGVGLLSGTPTTSGSFPITIRALQNGCLASKNSILVIAPNTTTWNGTAWSNGIPNAQTDVILAGNYTTSNTEVLLARTINVQNNSVLTIAAGATISAMQMVQNNGVIQRNCNAILTTPVIQGNSVLVEQPMFSSIPLPRGKLNSPYEQSIPFSISFGTNPIYTLDPSSILPDGLEIVGNRIVGVPTESGSYLIKVRATEGGCTALSGDMLLNIKDLIDPGLDFDVQQVTKYYGDEPFVLPINSKNGAVIEYSIRSTGSCATIHPFSGEITITCASPTTDIWIKAQQSSTTVYDQAVDSIRLIVLKAPTSVVIHTASGLVVGQNKTIDYTLFNYDGSGTFSTSSSNSIAEVNPIGNIIPKAPGRFTVDLILPATQNFTGLDTTLTFTVYPAPVAPVAIADTVILIRDLNGVIQSGSVNLLRNDYGVTSTVKINLTDIDLVNAGAQNLFYSPSIGNFDLDTIVGTLLVRPFQGLAGVRSISYTISDVNGLVSAPAKIFILIRETLAIPELKINEIMTPNNDGLNDYLIIGNTNIEDPNYILIFDEAGNTLYEKENYKNDWNGVDKKGNPLESGVYYYVFREQVGSKREINGYFNIKR